jgi:hypothetical protein
VALESGAFRHGGITIGARVDTSQVPGDLATIGGMLSRFVRDNEVAIAPRVAVAASSRAPGGAAPRAPGAGLPLADPMAGVAAQVAALGGKIGRSVGGLGKALDGVIDNVNRIARAAKVQEGFTKSTERAQGRAFRAERRDWNRAQALRIRSGGELAVERPDSAVGRLPADTRAMLGGVGFDRHPQAVARGAEAAAQAAGAAVATAVARVQAAVGHGKAGGPVPMVLHPDIIEGALKRGRLPGGFLDPSKTEYSRGSLIANAAFRRPRKTAAPPGAVAGEIAPDATTGARTSKRSGKIDIGLYAIPARTIAGLAAMEAAVRGLGMAFAGAGAPAAAAGLALAKVGAALKVAGGAALLAKAGLVAAGAAALPFAPAILAGSAALMGFGRTGKVLAAVQRNVSAFAHDAIAAFSSVREGLDKMRDRFGRIWGDTSLLRGAIALPFRGAVGAIGLATRAVGLWDSRVGTVTNSLKLLGRTAGTLTAPLTAPFRAAQAEMEKVNAMLGRIAGGIAAAGVAMVGAMAIKGVKAAADLAESVDRVRSVFGAASGKVQDFASSMAGQFGKAKAELMETQALFGTMLAHAGKGQDATAGMANELARRAQDMASFWGKSGQEAGDAVSRGLAGSFRGLRDFGVILDEDAVKATAVAMGLAKSTDEVSRAAAVQARYKLILEQTADAHGHLDRAANSTNHLMAEIWGRVENAAAALGEKLKPAFDEILLLVVDIQEGLTGFHAKVNDVMGAAAGAVKGFVHVLRQMWNNWSTGVELVGALTMQIVDDLGAAIGRIAEAFGKFFGWFTANWRTIFTDAFELVAKGVENLVKNFADLGKAFVKWVKDPLNNPFEFKATSLLEGFKPETPAPPALPDFDLPHKFQGLIDDLMARIMETKLPREAGGIVPRGVGAPAEELPDREGKGRKGRAGEHPGQLLGARELLDSLQRSVFDKDSKHIEETARATVGIEKRIADFLGAAGAAGAGAAGWLGGAAPGAKGFLGGLGDALAGAVGKLRGGRADDMMPAGMADPDLKAAGRFGDAARLLGLDAMERARDEKDRAAAKAAEAVEKAAVENNKRLDRLIVLAERPNVAVLA